MKKTLTFFLYIFFANTIFSQSISPAGGGEFYYEKQKCLATDTRDEIIRTLKRNVIDLEKKGVLKQNPKRNNLMVAFDWPLQKAGGLSFNSYYSTGNFVDQDNSSGLLDYNCGSRTYNGHYGTDIGTWPFPWYLYNNNFVEVIAGKSGIIVGKTDGNNDDHCSCSGDWNAVYVQHSDGSTAWYGHLKKNSVTAKSIGQTVIKGEYLGIVASSGCSSGPHLHFEIYDASNNLIDPYSGACNSLNGSSWWSSQPAYREPTLNALLTHDAVPVHGCPGGNEEPNISNIFIPGQVIHTAAYYHDQSNGDISYYKIRTPNNSIWQSWSHTSNETYTASWWFWNWVLPNGGPFGTWTFEVEYNGQVFQHSFQFQSTLPVQLTSFTGRMESANSILLNWETASETNNLGFELEKSISQNSWEKLTFIEGSGTASEPHSYRYLDNTPYDGLNYYRLKQIDLDGREEYSKVISIDMKTTSNVLIYHNPMNNYLHITGGKNENKIKIYDSLGRVILTSKNTNLVDISQFADGIYFVFVESEGQSLVKRIFKN